MERVAGYSLSRIKPHLTLQTALLQSDEGVLVVWESSGSSYDCALRKGQAGLFALQDGIGEEGHQLGVVQVAPGFYLGSLSIEAYTLLLPDFVWKPGCSQLPSACSLLSV